MPITVDSEIRVFTQNEFHELAHRILGIAFGVHNDFGRLVNEEIFKQAILQRCESAGIIPARREVRISITHNGFEKQYLMDLLFAHGLMVEAKTVGGLNDAHYAQTLQYLLLTGMRHGLLINLRQEQVKHKYVSTTLDLPERRKFTVLDTEWRTANDAGHRIRELFLELMNDWGAFLQISLYREAIIHFLGGPDRVLQKIPIFDKGSCLGVEEVCLLTDDTGLALTAMSNGQLKMRDHLQRFLNHTQLTWMQWINMNHHSVEFSTLEREESIGRMMGAE